MKNHWSICRFDSAGHLRGRARTHAAVKAAVLEQGRFSVFEATATRESARLFTQLENDPKLERVKMGFPWIGLRRRSAAASSLDAGGK